jgi:hypothetical protein
MPFGPNRQEKGDRMAFTFKLEAWLLQEWIP